MFLRRRLRVLLLVLVIPFTTAAAQDLATEKDMLRNVRVADSSYWGLATGVYASGLADWDTTRQFREQGIDEANPIMEPLADNDGALLAVKLGGGTLVNYASWSLKREGKRYWAAPQIAWIVLNLAVSLHNANQMDEER